MTLCMASLAIVLAISILAVTPNAGGSTALQEASSLGEARQFASMTLRAQEALALKDGFQSNPVMFIENAGQWDDGARFQVWGGPAGTMWLAEDAIWITVLEPGETDSQVDKEFDPGARWPSEDREDPAPRRGVNIKLSFVGANPQPRIETFDRLDTVVSYFYGNDPDQWRPDVPVWGGVRYVELYPGIDLELTNEDGRMVQRLAAQPGADLAAVQLRVEGPDDVAVDGDRLRLSTAAGEHVLPLLQTAEPSSEVIVQSRGEGLFDVATPFTALSPTLYSPLAVPDSPADNPADLLYGTFLGGSSSEAGYAIAVDGAGSAYVTGYTSSIDFPTTPGAFDPSFNGNTDAFVVKLKTCESGLCISHIEVTQATQSESNAVPLVAAKPTIVRVYVDCGEGCTSQFGVTGVLRGYGSSGQLPGSPLAPITGAITAHHEDWRDQRQDLRKTLNFLLPPAWRTGTYTLIVEVSGASESKTVTFQPARSVNVVYVPIRYMGQSPNLARIPTGAAWASRVYPTAKINYVPGMTIDWALCVKKDPLCPKWYTNARKLFKELTTQYRLVNAYVYGWLPNGAFGGGLSDPTWFRGAGKAAFGDDDPTEGALTLAHEIGHLMLRRHSNTNSCPPIDYNSDWPYANSSIQDYGIDINGLGWLIYPSGAIKKPANTYDYMSWCGRLVDDNVWTSGWTYSHIYEETLRIPTTMVEDQPLPNPQPFIIASGLIYIDDTATLDPAWVITSTITPENPPAGTQYCLEAQNVSGTALTSQCFDLTFMNYETGEATDGVNTSRDESDAAFTVERKAPQAFIISPEADSAALAGTPVWLEGYAYDLEAGALSDAALNWSSSRDGELGTGAQLLSALSLGRHTLTFTAIDGDANTATATLEFLATFEEDVVPDCQADVLDIQAIASRWQQQSNNPEWDGRFDLNGDGIITVVDIMHVAAAWGTMCQ